MTKSLLSFAIFLIAGIFFCVSATDESGIAKHVDKIGAGCSSEAIFTVQETFVDQALINATSYGFMYINLDTPGGKAAYAALLAAKANGSSIWRMAYHKDPATGLFWLDLLVTQ